MTELESLTEREKEIMRMVAEGKQNKEVAQVLNISLNTVETHLKNIFEKLQVRNRTEAVLRFQKDHG